MVHLAQKRAYTLEEIKAALSLSRIPDKERRKVVQTLAPEIQLPKDAIRHKEACEKVKQELGYDLKTGVLSSWVDRKKVTVYHNPTRRELWVSWDDVERCVRAAIDWREKQLESA